MLFKCFIGFLSASVKKNCFENIDFTFLTYVCKPPTQFVTTGKDKGRCGSTLVAVQSRFTFGFKLAKLLNRVGVKASSQTYFYFPFVLMWPKAKDEGLNPMACGFVLQPIHPIHNH